MGTLKNYLAIARYCQRYPQPWWRFPWVCWKVFKARQKLGTIAPMSVTGFRGYWPEVYRGMNSYGHWLRSMERIKHGHRIP